MLIAGLLITFFSWAVYFIRKDLRLAVGTFVGLFMAYILLIYKVLPKVLIAGFDFNVLVSYVSVVAFVLLIKYLCDIYIHNEVGFDVKTLLADVFPDKKLRLFALFFIGQLLFSNNILICLIMIYFIGKLLGVKRLLIFSIGYVSIVINMVIDQMDQIQYISGISLIELQKAQQHSFIFLLATMLIVFVYIVMVSIFIDQKNIKDETSFVQDDRKTLLILVCTYFGLIVLSNLLFSINIAQSITCFVMLFVISSLSRKNQNNTEVEVAQIEKQFPYIVSIMVMVCNGLFIYYSNFNLIVALLLIFAFNTFVLQVTFQKVDVVKTVEKDNDRFIYKIILIYALFYMLDVYVTNSAINNTSFGLSITDSLLIYFSEITNFVQYIFNLIGLSPFIFVIYNNPEVHMQLVNQYSYIVLYSLTIISSLNLFYFYIIHELLGIDEESMVNSILGIVAFMVIEMFLLVIIVTIF